MKKWIIEICNKILWGRYIIALFLLIVGVSLELHGSSISNWDNYGVSETVSGKKVKTINQFQKVNDADSSVDITKELKNWISLTPRQDGTLIGVPRMIRSDEWQVQTPFYLSQVNSNEQLINKSYGLEGQNMILAYFAPVKHISIIGKPFNWGFLFLGATRGLSWYWCFKILGMLLLSYEFAMILTRKNKLLSVVSSFWITFIPAVQWWFMQHLGDVVFFSLAIMVAIYHYFYQKKIGYKLLLATLLSISIIGFTLVIYPAFQVPFAFMLVLFFVIEFVSALREGRIKLSDWIIMVMTLTITALILGYTILQSMDAILASLNTVYPGSRISTGGEIKWNRISDLFVNFILPFKVPKLYNQVEGATSFNILLFVILGIPVVLKRSKLKENLFGLLLTLYCVSLFLYATVGIPKTFAKITMFSYMTSSRAWQALAVLAVLVSVWFIGYLWREYFSNLKKWLLVGLGLLTSMVMFLVTLFDSDYLGYVGFNILLVLAVVLLLIIISVLFKTKVIFSLLLVSVIFLSGMTVNPTVKGLSVIEDKKLSHEITRLVKKNPEAYWGVENQLYNYPQIFGARTINSVRFYPDRKLFKIIDSENKFENIWNRYSHMHLEVTDTETKMEVAGSPDSINIRLNINKLRKLKVKYILTNRNLDEIFNNQFKLIYIDKDNNKIYQYQK